MEDNLFDKLREMTGMVPERFSILEQQIDVKLQMEYFKYSKKLKKDIKKEQPIDPETINLYEPEYTNDALKELLVKLASLDNPKAFRVIEDYTKNGRPELLDWSVLAMQENKMLLESSLLNENQVFISTGLGGKGTMLRYFVVLIGADLNEFAEFQRKIITSEFDFSLKNSQSELEQIDWLFFNEKSNSEVMILRWNSANSFRSAPIKTTKYLNIVPLPPNPVEMNTWFSFSRELSNSILFSCMAKTDQSNSSGRPFLV